MKDYTKWFGKEWAQFLDPFLRSELYYNIGVILKRQISEGLEITPTFDNLFRSFRECPWHLLHTIIVGKDAYHSKTEDDNLIADGIAFSARYSTNPPILLSNIYDAISTSVYDGDYSPTCSYNHEISQATYDLSYLSKQGILMLDCGLTTLVGRSNEHINLWKPFIEYVIKNVTDKRDNLGVILVGNHAQALRPLITNKSVMTLSCEHPNSGVFNNRKWQHNNVFSELTRFQKVQNNIKITW